MLKEYLACSRMAEVQVLNLIEALACTEAGLAVKLSFIAGVEPRAYRELPLRDQVEMNLRAYQAYRDWTERRTRYPHEKCMRGRECGT